LSTSYQATLAHKGGSFTASYEFERQAGEISLRDVERHNNGVSLYEQFAWGQRVFITGGARIEHSSVFGGRIAPRGAITFRLPTDTYLRLNLGRGIKEPTLVESFAREQYYVGNPNLRPAKTDSFEAGIFREWFGRRIRTDVAYFRNRFTDRIDYDLTSTPGSWLNISKSWARGVEVSGSARMTSKAMLRASYTKLYTRIVTGNNLGLELLRRPRNSGTVGLQLTPQRWTFMIGARFVGERQDSDFGVFGVNRNPAYNYAYLSGSFQVHKRATLFLRVNNLTDEQYQEALGFAQWGRNASGGVRINW